MENISPQPPAVKLRSQPGADFPDDARYYSSNRYGKSGTYLKPTSRKLRRALSTLRAADRLPRSKYAHDFDAKLLAEIAATVADMRKKWGGVNREST